MSLPLEQIRPIDTGCNHSDQHFSLIRVRPIGVPNLEYVCSTKSRQ
jgi:hypothetical protein